MTGSTDAAHDDPGAAARDTRAAVAEAAQDAERLGETQPGQDDGQLHSLAEEAEHASGVSDAEIARDPEGAKRELDSTLSELTDAAARAARTDGADARSSAEG